MKDLISVKPGKHRFNDKEFIRINPSKAVRKIKFGELAAVTSLHINKIFGLAFPFVHKNSARFGFKYIDGKFNIYAYSYVDGERKEELMYKADVDEQLILSIFVHKDKVVYQIEPANEQEVIYEELLKTNWFSVELGAYWGGKPEAPQFIAFESKKINTSIYEAIFVKYTLATAMVTMILLGLVLLAVNYFFGVTATIITFAVLFLAGVLRTIQPWFKTLFK